MKHFSSSDISNLAIVGHRGSGKTFHAEALPKLGREINRLGTIEDGFTTLRSLTDYRGIHSESYSHYEKISKEFEQKVIQQRKKTEDE